jgi:hypothetical protein
VRKFAFRPKIVYNILVKEKLWEIVYVQLLAPTPLHLQCKTVQKIPQKMDRRWHRNDVHKIHTRMTQKNRLKLDFSLSTQTERKDFLDKYLTGEMF